jgi:hypothetical protein
MVLASLQLPRIREKCEAYASQTTKGFSTLLYSEPSPDGGRAAYDALGKDQKRVLYTKANGEEVQVWRIVDGYLKYMSTLQIATNLRKAASGWSFSQQLQGWDFWELAVKEDYVLQKEVPLNLGKCHGGSWRRITTFSFVLDVVLEQSLHQTWRDKGLVQDLMLFQLKHIYLEPACHAFNS